METLRMIVSVGGSRKNRIMVATAISTILVAIGFKDYPPEVIAVIIGGLVTIASVVVNSIKAEDVATKTAAGMVAAANVTAAVNATTTTVSTPGTSDVSVSASEPTKPSVKPIGLV